MPESFISFAFSAGVLSPGLLSRPDLEKYDLALRKGHNWIVDYRGGIFVRPPSEYCVPTKNGNEAVKLYPFRFNLFQGNIYTIVFGDEYIRFLQDGRYVTDVSTEATVTDISTDAPAVVTTDGAHGYSNGDWIYLSTGYYYLDSFPFIVSDATSTTFQLQIPNSSEKVDLAHLNGVATVSGTVKKVYEISSPYTLANLSTLDFDQYRDEVYITSTEYFPRKLVRAADNDWTIDLVDFSGNRNAPGAPTIIVGKQNNGTTYNPDTASTDAGVLYGVTAVNAEGQESYLKDIGMALNVIDITTERGFITLEWTAVSDAIRYNVYRSLFLVKSQAMTFAQELGYIGKTQAPIFQDNNIVPDFTQTPLVIDNPFTDGAILVVNVTAPGSGYGKTDTTISITNGTGFEGKVIVNDDGEVIGVRILNPGKDYANGAVTFGGAGTGATATINTSPVGGNNPSATAQLQQRRIYAGTLNLPMTIFASRVGQPDSFDFSSLVVADDAYDLSMDSPQLTPIAHLVKADLGLLVFSAQQVMQVRSTEDGIITPTTSKAENISDLGAEPIKPIRAEDNTLYIAYGSHSILSIEPTQLRNYYQVRDISVFSNHFFTPYNKVVNWTLSKIPQSIVWTVREDGSLVTMAYKPEQNVYAWTDHSTDGFYLDVVSVTEDSQDVVYTAVEREGNVYIERFVPFDPEFEYDNYATDSFFALPAETNNDAVTVSDRKGSDVTVSSATSSAIFTDVVEGDHIMFGGGLLEVLNIAADKKSLQADYIYPLEIVDRQTYQPYSSYASWKRLPQINRVRGLWHLEGKTLKAIVGTESYDVTVSDGEALLPESLPVRAVGLDYQSDLVTLPLKLQGAVVEDKKKNITDVSLRVQGARSFAAGTLSAGEFFDIEDQNYDDFELDQYINTSIYEMAVSSDWRDDDSIVLRKTKPFRGKLLGLVTNAEFGLD